MAPQQVPPYSAPYNQVGSKENLKNPTFSFLEVEVKNEELIRTNCRSKAHIKMLK